MSSCGQKQTCSAQLSTPRTTPTKKCCWRSASTLCLCTYALLRSGLLTERRTLLAVDAYTSCEVTQHYTAVACERHNGL